jgi:hypothetical protein
MVCSSPCRYKLQLVNLVLQVPGVLATFFNAQIAMFLFDSPFPDLPSNSMKAAHMWMHMQAVN